MKQLIIMAVFLAMAGLTGCGGGSGSSTQVVDTQPNIPNVVINPTTGATAKAMITPQIQSVNGNQPSGNVIAVGDNIALNWAVNYVSAGNYTVEAYAVRNNGDSNQDETGGNLLFTHTGAGSVQSDGSKTDSVATTMLRSAEAVVTTDGTPVSLTIDLTKSSTAYLANGATQPCAVVKIILKSCISEVNKDTGMPICSRTNTLVSFL